MDEANQAIYPTVQDIHKALKVAIKDAVDDVKYEAGADGWAPGAHEADQKEAPGIDEAAVLEETVREVVRQMGQLRPDYTDQDMTLAQQLHHLYSIYFTGRSELWRDCNPEAVVHSLVCKANRVESGRLWPEGSWVCRYHKPNPSWLSEDEYNSIVGTVEYAVEYKKMLRRLGYAPVRAPSKEALDEIWRNLYMINPDCEDTGSAPWPTSYEDRYAVVSYVQCASGRNPPATWTAEVDSVLTALVELGIITDRALWFDKLASRQYKDSQKWWGATATMQFLFNPIIVILPRMSEHSSFAPSVGHSIWGSGDDADGMYADFLEHARNCKQCQSSFTLRWALQHDHVIPAAALRTWPRVEHALGASGLGLFTSETTYAALVACLICAFAMFGAVLMNDPALYHVLESDSTPLPSTYLRADGSVLIGGWVVVSCSDWHYSYINTISMVSLKDMACHMNELHQLFGRLHNPRLVALGRSSSQGKISNVQEFEMTRLCEAPGLFYPKGEEDVDVPTLARFNTNASYVHTWSCNDIPEEELVVTLHHHWALAEIQRNQPRDAMSTTGFVAARQQALATLVYTRAAQAPCYAWDDKLVAAILLCLPDVFAEAVTFWNNGSTWLTRFSSKVLSDVGIQLAEREEIAWEPNTLIVALAMMRRNHFLHRLVPRPPSIYLSAERPVQIQPFVGAAAGVQQKSFAAFFLGHLPLMRTLDALCFRTSAGTKLPHINQWVYKTLQDGALCDINVVVIRRSSSTAEEQLHCWHCQKHLGAGKKPGDNTVLFDLPLGDADDDDDDDDEPSVMWGLGSFDPLNLASIADDDYFFGEQPDTVAVLLERAGDPGTSTTTFHAHALAHFTLLGSKQTHKCSSCDAIIIPERDGGKSIALWTILPILKYYKEIAGIIGEIK